MELAQKQQRQQQRNDTAPRYPAPSNQANAQRANQLSQQSKLAPRIPTNGGKNYAYLAEVHPKGFGVYNEEDDEHEQDP